MAKDLDDLLAGDETIILETRQHWFIVVRQVVVRLLVLVLLGVVIWYVGGAGWLDNRAGDWIGYAVWIGFAAVLVTVLWTLFGWITERFYVTSHKIIYAHGILNRNVISTPLVKIDEMTLKRPLLGRILGYGLLEVDNASGGKEPLAGLEYLPKPVLLYQMISERARNQRMIEGGAHPDHDRDGLADSAHRPPANPAPDAGGGWKPSGDSTAP